MNERNEILGYLILSVAMYAAALLVVAGVIAYQFSLTDTSDWFEPSAGKPTIQIGERGTGVTVNPQKTVDVAELQGSGL